MRGAYLETLYSLASRDKNVYAVISDNGAIVYDKYRADFPNQFVNAGISEANMVAMAAGMAERGKIPFAYTIGAFLAYRAYEFILNDVCLMNKNVKMVGIGAGCSYSLLGSSHHAIFDLAVLRPLPNLTILSPASPMEVKKCVETAYEIEGPVYIRLGTSHEAEIYTDDYDYKLGEGVELRSGNDATIISTGSILKDVLDIVDEMSLYGVHIRVINMHSIKPFDDAIVRKAIEETGKIITVEDHSVDGGIGTAVAEVIVEYGCRTVFRKMGLSTFSHGYGTYEEVKTSNDIGKNHIKETIQSIL